LQRHLDPERLVFIDETWIKTNMTPIRGWEPSTIPGAISAGWSKQSNPTNAQTISKMQDMLPSKHETL
jgi:3-mercaptopyruvate sulfurtransferase SseA